MLKGFYCPKAKEIKISFDDCLAENGCLSPDKERCMSRATLKLMSQVRPWKSGDKFSTTQLLNGIMYEYLRITKDYYESPYDLSYRVLGTKIHASLEDMDDNLSLSEEKFSDGENMTGTIDVIEMENGTNTLIDHKVCGYYKVFCALGVKSTSIPTGERYKTGEKVGLPKYKTMRKTTNDKDMFEWEMQLNRYRLFLQAKGTKVDKMMIEAIIRDFSYAPSIDDYKLKEIEFIPVRLLPDQEVLEYFNNKIQALNDALEGENPPTPCNEKENWSGRRCEKYCPVAVHCPNMKKGVE